MRLPDDLDPRTLREVAGYIEPMLPRPGHVPSLGEWTNGYAHGVYMATHNAAKALRAKATRIEKQRRSR